jgi:hypothetical protein
MLLGEAKGFFLWRRKNMTRLELHAPRIFRDG